MNYTILQGDNRDTLKTLEDCSVDAIVTDPPYGIDFLGKSWDANTGALETYTECLRVLKPGGYILAFSAARTYHHLAVTLEQAGFEIRDQLMWLYASGFPKAQDIGKAIEKREGKIRKRPDIDRYEGSDEVIDGNFGSIHGKCSKCQLDIVAAKIKGQKQECPVEGCEWTEVYRPADNEWAGWKTALKPAHEPICMARKPFKGSTIDNVLTHGVGALNIDATRIPAEQELIDWYNRYPEQKSKDGVYENYNPEVSIKKENTQPVDTTEIQGRYPSNVLGEVEGYQKFFYCPKVNRAERHVGFDLDNIPDPLTNYAQGDVKNHPLWDPSIGTNVQRLKHKILEHNKTLGEQHQVQGPVGNNHPTVKPVELMKYLIKLVTPPNSTVLDPFNGSGSTGMAAVELGHTYIGCELDPAYVEIAQRRIEAWNTEQWDNNYTELFE